MVKITISNPLKILKEHDRKKYISEMTHLYFL